MHDTLPQYDGHHVDNSQPCNLCSTQATHAHTLAASLSHVVVQVMAKPQYGADWRRLRLEALRRYGTTCWICGKPGADTVDHLNPVHVVGAGLPSIYDVRPAHRACNTRRGNRTRRWNRNGASKQSREW
jgi:5-methylcytosine-specific restriction endonuclease McrA